uniref:Uncharacterized protein n=1 Tax=Rhizophora mucronata TaxID=61149 RepID=A0A2P2NA44_RHIMU
MTASTNIFLVSPLTSGVRRSQAE